MSEREKTYTMLLLDEIDKLTKEIQRLEEENKRLEQELEMARETARLMEDDGR